MFSAQRFFPSVLSCVGLLVGLLTSTAAAQEIRVRSALVTLIDDVQVPAEEAGVLVSVNAQVGGRVQPGQLLARIYDKKAMLAHQRSETELRIAGEKAKNDTTVRYAKKSKAVAAAKLKRALESVERFPGSISASEIDELRLSVDRADAQIAQAEADLKIAGMTQKLKANDRDLAAADVKSRRIVSTISGKVVEVKRQSGEWVKPGDKVFRVISLDRLRATGFVKFAQIRGKLEGRTVTLMVDLPGQPRATFRGKVTFVSDEVDPNNGEVAVWAEIQNPNHRLKPGLSGAMTIHASNR